MNDSRSFPVRTSHGTGEVDRAQFRHLGHGVIIEPGVLVFHPDTIEIGDHVYVGHYTILKGHHLGSMSIGSGTWIGQPMLQGRAPSVRATSSISSGMRVSPACAEPVEMARKRMT